MGKFVIFGLVVALCLVASLASPLPDFETLQEGDLIRQKRVTCDVLSFEARGIAINHSACALHCLVLGRKGGSCSDGVCVCRR